VDYESLLSEKTTLEEKVIQLSLVIKEHETEKEIIIKENEQLSKDITSVKNDLSALQASLEFTAITKSTVEEVSRPFHYSQNNNLTQLSFCSKLFSILYLLSQ
jgi:predicted  nucleic acid-binding Zn-ribbon protein